MRIGFYLKWEKGSLGRSKGNVLGDELYAESLAKELNLLPEVTGAEVYSPSHLPEQPLDVMIYMNDTAPDEMLARKHLLYLQNAYGNGSDLKLEELRAHRYDGYAFISQTLLSLHRAAGYEGLFLPFGVDAENFSPRPVDPKFSFEVAYVGNDIKGPERTNAYLFPALPFDFGLFGNWLLPRSRFRIWKNWGQPEYRKRFAKISRGKIPQEQVPVLYSSAKINLNCTAQDCVDWDVITLRSLEVMACDGFLISDRVPSAEHLLGDYAVFTDGGDDLGRKIDYYLLHEGERRLRAEAGGRFVRDNFSMGSTSRNLLRYLKEL
ncbi:MAG TPA: hypothetical protein DD435_16730 [Cyanobacteria bacterium UBA8530]|nr:hypothetical protein [Cyanobacteria bacterium UBA8530]